MDRPIQYTQEQARGYDFLWAYKDALIGIGWLEADLTGQTTALATGLAATATAPASLNINLGGGRIYQLSAVDATNYGLLPSDATLIMQQGNVIAQAVALSTSGLSSGQSRWALIEANFAQVDDIPADDPNGGVPFFWNSANPAQPLQGMGGTGGQSNTRRRGTASITVVYGAPATTGSEVPPSASVGAIGLYLVDLTFGQTQVIQGNILTAGPSVGPNVPSNYPQAPFLAGLLNAHHNGKAGQAPQIDLTAEVKNILPLLNLPGSSTTGGGIGVIKLNAGNPNSTVAGNFNVNGATDFCVDTVNKIVYWCSQTGNAATAVWTAIVGSTSSQFAGGTTTGAANAQVISSTTPAGFSLTAGYIVTATVGAGLTNTGATTLNVDGTGAIAVNKTGGPLTGGELIAGNFVSFLYTGTVWLLQANTLGQLATLNIGQWLKNDGAGNLTIKNGLTLGDDGAGNFTVQPTSVHLGMLSFSAARQRAYVQPLSTQGAGNLTLSNDGSSPTFVVDIASGRVSSDDDTVLLPFPGQTKRLDQSWAPGTATGGCDTSTKAANQTWHAYIIGKGLTPTNFARTSNVASLTIPAHNLGVGSGIVVVGIGQGFDGFAVVSAVTTNTLNFSNAGPNVSTTAAPGTANALGVDAIFSQSYPTPAFPTGYSFKQCLGSVITDGSGNIIQFTQTGDLFTLATTIVVSPTLTANVGALVQVSALQGFKFLAKMRIDLGGAGTPYSALITSPDESDQGIALGVASLLSIASVGGIAEVWVMTNTSGQIRAKTSVNSGPGFGFAGWRDPRRRLF